jgi:hypothetical protein
LTAEIGKQHPGGDVRLSTGVLIIDPRMIGPENAAHDE